MSNETLKAGLAKYHEEVEAKLINSMNAQHGA